MLIRLPPVSSNDQNTLQALIVCHIPFNESNAVILIKQVVESVGDWEARVSSARRDRAFKFRGGVLCLDFVNTVSWRLTDGPVEYLGSYEDLLAWGNQAGLLTPEEARILSGRATTDPEEARATMSRAIGLREAVHRVVSAAIVGERPDEDALEVLNREISGALSRLRVVHTPEHAHEWAWDRGGRGQELDYPLWPVARSAAELLTSPKLGRVNVCAGEGCGWMFLDESRNGSRRWCDSRDCGNRERVQKHLARKRATQ
jgi:predicted RNA-binding Zn ribbon-like protein